MLGFGMTDYEQTLELQNEELLQRLHDTEMENDDLKKQLEIYESNFTPHWEEEHTYSSGENDPTQDKYIFRNKFGWLAKVIYTTEHVCWYVQINGAWNTVDPFTKITRTNYRNADEAKALIESLYRRSLK